MSSSIRLESNSRIDHFNNHDDQKQVSRSVTASNRSADLAHFSVQGDQRQYSESVPVSSARSTDDISWEISEIEEEGLSDDVFEGNNNNNTSGVPLGTIREEVSGSLFSFDFHNSGDVVYVAVGKNEDASMDALRWAMSHLIETSSIVFLIHIFPEIKQIPTPLGMMPIDQVNPKQKATHLAQERGKRRDYLQKFINVCSNSKVKVDTILVESNMEAKAILDLIPILNIKTLIVGTSKRSIRSKRVSGSIGQILKGAPEYCEVKVVCDGKEMADLIADTSSPRATSSTSPGPNFTPNQQLEQVANNINFMCGSCFKPKVENNA